jgi:hypothetical protein
MRIFLAVCCLACQTLLSQSSFWGLGDIYFAKNPVLRMRGEVWSKNQNEICSLNFA